MSQVFSCEFCEISKSTFLTEHPGGCFCTAKHETLKLNLRPLKENLISKTIFEFPRKFD